MNFGFYEGAFGLLDPEVDDYIQYSLMAGLGNLLAWIFAPLGFGNWESTVTSITGLVAKENVVATVGVLTSLGEEIGETDPSHVGRVRRHARRQLGGHHGLLRLQPAVRAVLRRHRHHPSPDVLGEVDLGRHRLHERSSPGAWAS